jgi:hypothetical protein
MQEDDGGTISGGEQMWVAGSDDCWEGSSGWMVRIGRSYNAVGCWEEDTKGLGSFGSV